MRGVSDRLWGAYSLVRRGPRWSDEVMRTRLNRTAGSRALAVTVAAVLVLGASACGGGKKSDTTTSTSGSSATVSVKWANGVCSAFTEWKTTLQQVKTTLKGGNLSVAQLTQALGQAKDATNKLAQSLQQLGMPDTPDADEAKTNIAEIKSALSASMGMIEASLSGGAPSASELQTVGQQISYMAGVLTRSVASLKHKLNSGSQVGKVFHQAPACSAYFAS
jgi:hypothetical protein